MNCTCDLKIFGNCRPSVSNFKSFSRSLEQFFLTVDQNNFSNKIPFLDINNNFDVFDDLNIKELQVELISMSGSSVFQNKLFVLNDFVLI